MNRYVISAQRALTLSLLLCLAPCMTQDAQAQRKGFVLGFGVGPGQVYYFQSQDAPFSRHTPTKTKLALVTDFKIGYAPNEQLMLYWFSNVAWLRPNDGTFIDEAGGSLIAREQRVT